MVFDDDSEDDVPDWLSSLGAGSEEPDTGADQHQEDQSEDWLADADAEDAASGDLLSESPDEAPDWLAAIRQEESARRQEPMADEPAGDAPADEDEDVWLEGIRSKVAGDFEDADQPEEGEEPGDFLDTIRAMKAEEDQPPLDDPEDVLAGLWDQLENEIPADAAEEDQRLSESGEASEEALPDWVSGMSGTPFAGPEDEAATPSDEETPPWLQSIRQHADEVQQSAEDFASADEEEPDLPAFEQEDPESDEARKTDPPATTGSLPAWMETLQTAGLVMPADSPDASKEEVTAYSPEEITDLFADDDLPEWLGPDDQARMREAEEQKPPEQTERPIEKSELPGWLQAIRPVEAVTAVADDALDEEDADEDRKAERVGPLSGLSDVLPAEPHIVHFGSPARVIPTFEFTDIQKKYAGMLRSQVQQEAQSTPAQRRTTADPQQILRWVIAILLLAVVFAVIWIGPAYSLPLPDPQGMPAENLAVISLVNSLNPEDRVLLAFEYQPGLSGEMEAASTGLIQHLLLRDVQLVLVSTQPIGPGLGEAFLQEGFAQDAYIGSREYVNLGYVSGGAAGLLNFAADMRAAKPEAVWDQPPLAGMQSISDFALVLVLTDDPDTARSWIEQVQPMLDPLRDGQGVPLAMAVSAQAEPLVYPYYSANPRQVDGLVSGVTGGAFYETVIGGSTAELFWSPYNAGMLLAVVVIAAGSIINLARNSLQGLGRKGRSDAD
jgi:hypothetical protein